MDEHLIWIIHIDHLCCALLSKISLLKQLSTYDTKEILKKFYQMPENLHMLMTLIIVTNSLLPKSLSNAIGIIKVKRMQRSGNVSKPNSSPQNQNGT